MRRVEFKLKSSFKEKVNTMTSSFTVYFPFHKRYRHPNEKTATLYVLHLLSQRGIFIEGDESGSIL